MGNLMYKPKTGPNLQQPQKDFVDILQNIPHALNYLEHLF